MKILLLGHGVANDGCMRLLDKYKLEYDYLDTDKVTRSSYDYIVKSPGIPLFDEVFSKISGTIISDIALGYILLKPRIIGITGSNGKTNNKGSQKSGVIIELFKVPTFLFRT